jgi:hypothetical protein
VQGFLPSKALMTEPTAREPLMRLGDFAVLRQIGRGGMGTVYEAIQLSLNRRVALKVLSGGIGLAPTAVARFHREAEAAARLHHSNIVPVYATGEEAGTHYYAMELVEGPSLLEVIRQVQRGAAAGPGRGAAQPGGLHGTPVPDWAARTIGYEPAQVAAESSRLPGESSPGSGARHLVGSSWAQGGWRPAVGSPTPGQEPGQKEDSDARSVRHVFAAGGCFVAGECSGGGSP